jgi:hypothetical protein
MGKARIYRLPGEARRRWRLLRHGREELLLWSREPRSDVPGALLAATLLLAWLYLFGAAGIARHDAAYGALLAGVWAGLVFWDALLESRAGALLTRAVRVLAGMGGVAFLPAMYWIILGR